MRPSVNDFYIAHQMKSGQIKIQVKSESERLGPDTDNSALSLLASQILYN